MSETRAIFADIVRERAERIGVKLDDEQVTAIVDENDDVWDRAISDAAEDLIYEYEAAMPRKRAPKIGNKSASRVNDRGMKRSVGK